MCQALRDKQLAGHPWKIDNTLSKTGPCPGSQNFSFQAVFGPLAMVCTLLDSEERPTIVLAQLALLLSNY